MVKKSASINLIKTNNKDTINHIVNWALTIGRVLIVVVEVVALSALLYRFILDNELRSVHETIKQEQAILESQKTNEETYRNLQDRLTIISSISNKAPESIKIIKDIISFAPLEMNFSNISLGENTIKIEAGVSSIYPLSQFVNSLKSYKNSEYISIDKIENKTDSGIINVIVSIGLKKKGVANAATSTK